MNFSTLLLPPSTSCSLEDISSLMSSGSRPPSLQNIAMQSRTSSEQSRICADPKAFIFRSLNKWEYHITQQDLYGAVLSVVMILKAKHETPAIVGRSNDSCGQSIGPKNIAEQINENRRRNTELTIDCANLLSLDKWKERLAEFSKLKTGWDSYRAFPPSKEVLHEACKFLDAIRKEGQEPSKMNPSVVGGVGFTFRRGARSVYVEFRNTGNAHAAFIDGSSEPEIIRIDQDKAGYVAILAKAKKHLHEQTTRGHEIKGAST